MAFFSKLKDKLFKSSSKLEQGLDAIVEEAGEPAPQTADTAPVHAEVPEAPTAAGPAAAAPPAASTAPGLVGRLLGRKADEPRRVLDDDMLEQLEELLITSDMGVDTALRVTANMAEGRFGKKLSTSEIKQLLAAEIARIMAVSYTHLTLPTIYSV